MADGDSPNEDKIMEKIVVVILIGAPGSGKTTFCNHVMSTSRRQWVRVCQDTIANGKAGTKQQCIKSATDALKDHKSVFIDRCNLERDQRAEFIKLGGRLADVHAVVLDLPARLCIQRSVKRTGHEGNLQGGKAAAVVNRMLQKKELPNLSEGFSRITFCLTDGDVKDAVSTYRVLGPYDNLAPGVFGQKGADSKVQLGIMRFLKKVDAPEKVAHTTDGCKTQNVDQKQDFYEQAPCSMEIEKDDLSKEELKHTEILEKPHLGCSDYSLNDVPTLAFPSISTSDFQFNHEKASDIIVKCVAEFLAKGENVRLLLVDLSPKSNILSLVRAKAAKRNIDSNKFFTFVGDITRLCSEGGLRCHVIANAANWRLKPGGGGVNAAIFDIAGKGFEIATKERAETLTPGNCVVVPLPMSSPLYKRESVSHVIHVVGPNMNPHRPNCLQNDYTKGCKVLYEAYTSLFNNFANVARMETNPSENDRGYGSVADLHGNAVVASNLLLPTDQKSKREASHESESNKKSKGLLADQKEQVGLQQGCHTADKLLQPDNLMGRLFDVTDVTNEKVQKNRRAAEATKRNWGSWAQTLHEMAMLPEKHKDVIIEKSDSFIVINDLYPKAKRHLLVISRLPGLDCLAQVRREHLPVLRDMHVAGLNWAKKFKNDDPSLVFRLGYHSVPSMQQLHLHVVSQDFDSPSLKNKKHWNSFTTPFFRDSADVLDEVDKFGIANVSEDEKVLSMELRCNRCRSAHPNIPRLKSHIANCKHQFPPELLQNDRLL